MKEFFKNIKKGITISFGFIIGIVLLGTIYVFATGLTATTGETLTAQKWNDLVAKFNNCTVSTYSTSEALTGERWIDGKPIYKKVYTGISLTSDTSTSIMNVIGDNPAGFENVISMKGSIKNSVNSYSVLPYDNAAGSSVGQFILRSATDGTYPNKFTLRVQAGWANGYWKNYSISVEYTKTSDTGASPVVNICQ